MNFFKAQDKARRHTSRLIFLFALAVICLIILTNLLFIATFSYMGTDETEPFISVVKNSYDRVGVSLLILLGSIYKVISLSKGGPAIAEMLGGQLVPQSTTDAEERKLLNIVEEMSIAAGMPIPQVYILEESSINAFAAGQSQSNAVIGVTRGSLSQLSRDELQGLTAWNIINWDHRPTHPKLYALSIKRQKRQRRSDYCHWYRFIGYRLCRYIFWKMDQSIS